MITVLSSHGYFMLIINMNVSDQMDLIGLMVAMHCVILNKPNIYALELYLTRVHYNARHRGCMYTNKYQFNIMLCLFR